MNNIKSTDNIKKAILILLAGTLLAGMLTVLPIHSESEIYDKVIRLHILANSDSEEDQAVKLKVRDGVLEYVGSLIESCNDIDSAKEMIGEHLNDIKTVSENVLINNGFTDEANVLIGNEEYPERGYDNLKLPAGEYCSLRISIGNAEGHNWWCVLFPPLCVSAAKPQDVLVEAGFTPNQVRILTETDNPKYVLRFKILEFFEALRNR